MLVAARPTNSTAIAETTAALARHRRSYETSDHHSPLSCKDEIDSYVQRAIGATNGNLYAGLRGRLDCYPIPLLDLPLGAGRRLLDVGSNWGRWTIAAARLGYNAVGIDPSFDAISAARNVARALGAATRYVVADARYLPFAERFFDVTFSYSVMQHFALEDFLASAAEMGRVTTDGGKCKVQMLQPFGVRSLYHQMRRGFRAARDFEVRYWRIGQLHEVFGRSLGPTCISVDGFFSANARPEDCSMLPRRYRAVVWASETLRRASRLMPALIHLADSVWITARRERASADKN